MGPFPDLVKLLLIVLALWWLLSVLRLLGLGRRR